MTPSLAAIDLLEDTWARAVPYEQFELLRREAPVYPDVEPAGEQRRMRSDFVNGIKYLPIRLDRVRA